MVILFGLWNNIHFLKLRPGELPAIPRRWGLNNASPLTCEITSYVDIKKSEDPAQLEDYIRRCKIRGNRLTASNRVKAVRKALEGGAVVISISKRDSGLQFSFTALGHHFRVSSPFGTSVGLNISRTVNVMFSISGNKPHRNLYTTRVKGIEDSSRLRVKLRGISARGPSKGARFEK